jgi:hypothetical protein
MALLIAGMQVEDKGAMTANSCQHAIARFGDAAIPAIASAIASSSDSTATLELVAGLRLIHTDKSTELLLQLYGSGKEELRNNAAYAMIHQPFERRRSRIRRYATTAPACG